mgnify:CR=1 FL=1
MINSKIEFNKTRPDESQVSDFANLEKDRKN